MILTIRTDNQQAEIGLFSKSGDELTYKKWQAHRQLSSTILVVIKELLSSQKIDFKDLAGVIFYEGPGSFTGLRIGASVANALQLSCANVSGENWIKTGLEMLGNGAKDIATPSYGSEPHTTVPKK